MAKVFPARLGSDTSAAERVVYERLGQALSDEFTLIYGISFTDPQNKVNRQRKIDFLIVHPDLGLLVLQVCGGPLRLADNQWHTSDQFGNDRIIANPYRRTQDDRAAFSRWLRQDGATSEYATIYNRHIGYALVLPNTDAAQTNLGLTASPRNTIDKSDLEAPDAAVRRVMEHAETNYQIPPQVISVLVGALTEAQAAPQPTAASKQPAPPALQGSGSSSLEARAAALAVALIAVALLMFFLLANRNPVSQPAAVVQASASATSTPRVVAVLATTTPTHVALAASATPFVPTPSISASAVPTPSTPTPVVPTESAPNSTSSQQLAIGIDALVKGDSNLQVRKRPSTDAEVLVKLGPGVKVHITDGPQQANGFTWWKIANWPDANGASGWCAGEFLQPVAAP